MVKQQGLLLVICGPSGAGKGSIYKTILHRMPNVKCSVSVTTRQPRKGEVDGVDYHFKSIEQYQQMIAAGEFLETASVFNNFYGTPKKAVMEMLDSGHDVIFEIDVVGAAQIKDKYPQSILIFVMTPGFDVLESRLRQRATETEQSIITRLNGARAELERYKMFDYLILNENLDEAVDSVQSIILSEKRRMHLHVNTVENMLKQ